MDGVQSKSLVQLIRKKAQECSDRQFGKDILQLIEEYEVMRYTCLRLEKALHNIIKQIEDMDKQAKQEAKA